jgi:uncharacterized membrane protein
MKKLKNYGLWVAIFAFIPLLLDGLKVYDISIILPGNYDTLISSFLGILVLAGIISNPSNGKGFGDK